MSGGGDADAKEQVPARPRAAARTRASFWAPGGDAPRSAPLALPAPQWASSSRVPGRKGLPVGLDTPTGWARHCPAPLGPQSPHLHTAVAGCDEAHTGGSAPSAPRPRAPAGRVGHAPTHRRDPPRPRRGPRGPRVADRAAANVRARGSPGEQLGGGRPGAGRRVQPQETPKLPRRGRRRQSAGTFRGPVPTAAAGAGVGVSRCGLQRLFLMMGARDARPSPRKAPGGAGPGGSGLLPLLDSPGGGTLWARMRSAVPPPPARTARLPRVWPQRPREVTPAAPSCLVVSHGAAATSHTPRKHRSQ